MDGRVGGGKASDDVNELYKKKLKDNPISTTKVDDDKLKEELSKLATSAIWAREIESDDSDLHDGKDDPLSFGTTAHHH